MSMDISGPALAPPAGQTSHFDNPPNNNSLGLGAFLLMLAIASLFFCIRAYGKLYVIRRVEVEDVLLLLAFVNYIITFWTDMMYMKYPGFFVHTWDATLGTEIEATYYVFLFGVFYSVALALVKIAIPLEWCRLFVVPGTWKESYFWWGAMFVVTLQSSFLVVILVLLNVQCIPHEAIWDLTMRATAKCIDLTTLQKLSASVHLITDVAIFLLPQKVIFDLNMSIQKRLGLAVVFSLGLLGVICSVFRLVDTLQLAGETDVLYYTGPVMLWCTAEITCGFFVACAPILPRVAQETPGMRRLFGSSARGGSGGAGGAGGGGSASHLRNLGIQTIGGTGGPPSARRKRGKPAADEAYSQIDDDDEEYGLAMNDVKTSAGSTEHLRGSDGGGATPPPPPGSGIVRTTHVTITTGSRSETGYGAGSTVSPPWVRS